MLAGVDRRTPCGKRDYAILLLLVTYGLRGREVAALTLDDIDWKRERLAIPERKAGHSTAFPLSTVGRRGAGRLSAARLDRTAATGTCSSARWRRCEPIGAAAVCSPRPPLPAQGRCRGAPPGIAHAAPHLRAASGRRRLRVEDDRRLRRSPLAGIDRRSTPRSPSSRCARSPSATARRCCDDREPGLPRSSNSSRTSGRSAASTSARRPSCGCWCASPNSIMSTGSTSSHRRCSTTSWPPGPGRVRAASTTCSASCGGLLDWAVT